MSFVSVTEKPGIRVTREGLRMLVARYAYAASFCIGRDVLEVACGAGLGLGLLATRARNVVGGDFDETLLRTAQETYRDRINFVRLDAHCLPFSDASFDVVLLLEAIYYLAHPERFIRECHRVLRRDGVLLICTANKECRGFNPSPFSRRYFSSEELRQLLVANGLRAEILGGFPAANLTLALRVVHEVRRLAVLMHLIPKTMKGKEWLKRLFYGGLVSLASEINVGGENPEPVYPIAPGAEATRYKVLYAVGHAPANGSSPYSDHRGPGQVSLVESGD
jgi:SAM-dependent methyltransferase